MLSIGRASAMELPLSFDRLETAQDVDEAIHALFGVTSLGEPELLHVTSVWAAHPKLHVVMRINEATPTSEHDRFCLELARARADAIVLTGKILRDEPALDYHADRDRPWRRALARWRRERLGKHEPPWLLVLTRRPLPRGHHALRDGVRWIVYTDTAGLAADAGNDAVEWEFAVDGASSLASAVDYLRSRRGCRTVVLEAGPSTAASAYSPMRVDELMLSRYHGASVHEEVHGRAFPSMGELATLFRTRESPTTLHSATVAEGSGDWSFTRLVRRSSDDDAASSTPGARRPTSQGRPP